MKTDYPQTLQQAVLRYANEQTCIDDLVAQRWPDGVVCPRCGTDNPHWMPSVRRWKCRNPRCKPRQFSVKVGTIFEDSPLPLGKWLPALWLITNAKNGISSYEIARDLHVTQKTAWFMLHRIRAAMQDEAEEKMTGTVEVDETLVGGKARFQHKGKTQKERGGLGKAVVMGLVERGKGKGTVSKARAHVVPDQKGKTLRPHVHAHVEKGATVYTDELASYAPLAQDFVYEAINHSETYVRGNCHTNNAENFWCLLKRAIRGTYVSVEPWHLNRYLAEECFRYNERKDNDGGRFAKVLGGVVGKRLTYKGLIGETTEGLSRSLAGAGAVRAARVPCDGRTC